MYKLPVIFMNKIIERSRNKVNVQECVFRLIVLVDIKYS